MNLSESAKIRRSIASRHSEKEDDDMDAELLLLLVPIVTDTGLVGSAYVLAVTRSV
jgi:hypothetical protein